MYGAWFLKLHTPLYFIHSKLDESLMAVDVMHQLSPTRAYAKMAFGQKSKSIEELNKETAYPKMLDSENQLTPDYSVSTSMSESINHRNSSGSDKTSSSSSLLMDFSLLERSELAVEQLKTSRKQLEDEIGVCSEKTIVVGSAS